MRMRARGDKPAHSPNVAGTPTAVAQHIQRALKDGGSSEHATGVQWFFKDEIKSHGWYTADLRRAAVRSRRVIAAKPARTKFVFRWAKSKNRWHRRAACVALIRGARAQMFFSEITKLSDSLLADKDDMVQKGLGWLLRETAKFDAKRTVPYLMKIRARAPRLVLRTACETLPASVKKRVLAVKNRTR
jgi:hypothetical protein